MTTLTLVVVAKDHAEIEKFPLANVLGVADELVLIANPGARFGGLGAIGNQMLDRSRCDVVAIVHADTGFGPGALAALTQEDRVTGIVGRALDGRYVWSKDIQEQTPVSTLDSCSVFIPRALGLRFDAERFNSFHCCVEDLCLTAESHGVEVSVPVAVASHIGKSHGDPQWRDAHYRCRAMLAAKWRGLLTFKTT